MLGHLSFGVSDLERATAFYAALGPLGLTRVRTIADAAGYGFPGQGDLLALKQRAGAAPPGPGFISPSTLRHAPPSTPSTRRTSEQAAATMALPAYVPTTDPATTRLS